MRRCLTIACAALAIPTGAAALDLPGPSPRADGVGTSLSFGVERTTGDYGQARDTTITTVPVTFRLGSRPWQFGVTVPWIEVKGPGNVTRDLGRFRPAGTNRSESGVGDIVAFATRGLATGAGGSGLDATAAIKLGTASASKGLGTGEEDFSLQLDAYGGGGGLVPFGTLGHRWVGDPPGVSLRDVLFARLGAARWLDADTTAGLMWSGQERLAAGLEPKSELTAFYTRRFGAGWKAHFYGLLGLEDGSPDYGAGAFVVLLF
jgi:hypothetical protein